jgi:hypothetical protein
MRGHKIIQSLSEVGKQIAELYIGIDNFRKCHDDFRKARLSKISNAIIPIKRYDENDKLIPFETKKEIDNTNRPIEGALTVEEVSFDYFNKLIFYRCGQILAKTKQSSKFTKMLIGDINSIMISYYSEEVKHMLDVNDPGAVKGLYTQEDFIIELPKISAEHLLLKDIRISAETINLLDTLFSMIKVSPDRFEKQIDTANKDLVTWSSPVLNKGHESYCDNLNCVIKYYKEIQNRTIPNLV